MATINSTEIINRMNVVIDKLKNSGEEYTQDLFNTELLAITSDKLNNQLVYDFESDTLVLLTLSREIIELVKQRKKGAWKPKNFFGSLTPNTSLKLANNL